VGQIIPLEFSVADAGLEIGAGAGGGLARRFLKPAEQTPLSALRGGRIDAGGGIPGWRGEHVAWVRADGGPRRLAAAHGCG